MDQDRYADLRGRLDAAEIVLGMLLERVAFDKDGAADLKAEILRWSTGVRRDAAGNEMSLAQCDAMDGYARQVRQY